MESDRMVVFQTFVDIFVMLGAWPRCSYEKDTFYILKLPFAFLLSCWVPTCAYYHLIYNVYYHYKLTEREILEDFTIILGTTLAVLTYMSTVKKRNQILEIFRLLGHFEDFGKPPRADLMNKRQCLLMKLFVLAIWMGIGGYVFENAFRQEQNCIKLKEINKSVNVCGLLSNTVLPFDIDYYPAKQMFICLLFSSGCALFGVAGGCFYMLSATCSMLSVKIEHLTDMARTCFDTESREEKHNNLIVCVLYHLHIMEVIKKINECFGTLLLLIVTIFTVIISVIGFALLRYHSMKDAIYVGAFILVVVLIYGNGQVLLDRSEELNETIYNTSWYEQDVEIQKELLLLLLHSQKLMAIYADGFGEISRTSLAAFSQTAYSYVALLNSTMK